MESGSAFLLGDENDFTLLDCGVGAWLALSQWKYNLLEIRRIFISHWHADHAYDLWLVLFAIWRAARENGKEPDEVKVFGPKGTIENFNKLVEVFRTFGPMKWIKFHEGPGVYGAIETFEVEHGDMESLGVCVTVDGKRVLYTGDTGPLGLEVIKQRYKGLDIEIAILEGTFGANEANARHLDMGTVLEFLREIKPKHGVIVHIRKENREAVSRICVQNSLSYAGKGQIIAF